MIRGMSKAALMRYKQDLTGGFSCLICREVAYTQGFCNCNFGPWTIYGRPVLSCPRRPHELDAMMASKSVVFGRPFPQANPFL